MHPLHAQLKAFAEGLRDDTDLVISHRTFEGDIREQLVTKLFGFMSLSNGYSPDYEE